MHNNARRPRCSRATLFGKFADVQFPPLRVHTLSETSVRSAAWLFSIGGDGIMNLRRFTKVAPAFCGTVVLAGWIVAWLAGFGSASTDNTRAVPIENRAASLAANAELADKPQAIPMGNPVIASADVATAVESVTGVPVGALRTDAQARHHQGAGAEESDSQEEGQNEDCHENLYQARR